MADRERGRRYESRRRAANKYTAREGRAPDAPPDELVEYQTQCENDPEFFIEQNLSIAPIEGGELVPFLLNSGQHEVIRVVKEQLALGRCVQIIILKSRRRGITTLCEALVYWKTSIFTNVTGITLAHDKDTSLEIFRMAQTFKDTDRRTMLGLMPMIANSNEQALRFQNPDKKKRPTNPGLRSSFLVETAEGKGVGRSLTLQAVHCAEVAYYSKPGIATGLGIALTKGPGSIHIWESTANGVGNLFETTWNAAVEGRNEWIPIFLPWHTDERNVLPMTADEITSWEWKDQDEYELATTHNINLPHMKWRRLMLASPEMVRPGMSPEDVFRQEYPTTPEEAFVASGQNFFLPDMLKRLQRSPKGQRPPLFVGDLQKKPVAADGIDDYPPKMEFIENRFGLINVWEPPVPGYDYVIGGDVSEGMTNGDNSVAWVLCRNTQNYVARIRTRALEPDQFGQACAYLGWWYNEALVGIEQNGPGVAANIALRRGGYHRIWYDRDLLNYDEPLRKYFGWRTSEANRRPMLDTLEAEIRLLSIGMPAKEFYEEARTFLIVTMSSGHSKPTAAPSKRDDEIMAGAIALQLHMRGGAVRAPRKPKDPELDIFHPKCRDPKPRSKRHDPYEW